MIRETGIGGAYADFSDDRRLRYTWHRQIGIHVEPLNKRAVFVMLNPSTADAFEPDPTTKRCRKFAELWGCDSVDVVNLYAMHSPYPRDLYKAARETPFAKRAQVLGADAENDRAIVETCSGAHIIICAWGTNGDQILEGRGKQVHRMLEARLFATLRLGTTNTRAPVHPLARGHHFVPYDRKPERWIGES